MDRTDFDQESVTSTNPIRRWLALLLAALPLSAAAIKKDAFDYITKPFGNQRVLAVVQQALIVTALLADVLLSSSVPLQEAAW